MDGHCTHESELALIYSMFGSSAHSHSSHPSRSAETDKTLPGKNGGDKDIGKAENAKQGKDALINAVAVDTGAGIGEPSLIQSWMANTRALQHALDQKHDYTLRLEALVLCS